MTSAEWLDVEERKHSLGLEESEGGDLAWDISEIPYGQASYP